MAGNTNLGAAKVAKNDEFYTQWNDIEIEMQAYLEYDPDVFRGKTVLLPCDDPGASNFTKYFALNFEKFGLKKLISTSYAPASNPAVTEKGQMLLDFELGEDLDEKFNEDDTWHRGRIYVLEQGTDLNDDGRLNKEDLQWDYLEGDGDFRSEEVTKLRNEADIIVTNPPFSLFREFLAWLIEGDVQFSVIGNMNSVTYRDVFPLFQENRTWYGPSISSGDREFRVPDSYPLTAAGQRVDEQGNKFVRVKGVRWFTNIEHGRRHEPLVLMTMDDNLIYGSKTVRSVAYPKYDNYDAIEVPETMGIPSDYDGMMGVPISFLDKYSPDQFEILGITKTWDDGAGLKKKIYPTQTQVSKNGATSNVGKLNDGAAIPHDTPPENTTYYEVEGRIFTQPYARVLIRHRRPETKES
ncbi:adenine-specific methyltransferase EcoRI family protein [Corynebacterium sp. HMSC068G04]|uniref:adenine-specific methyltransferase EcoRI family protein n=1 Tax=Corynebacterium sp. HMSC068G04 TaxID=1739497 RepID=UPI0008A3AF7B|nr:adenine-specific methyltransferase EcoRI family protein [Corynebacterium sp. HMSC068G04]OFP26504.1 DNA methyltransferase [Corynebacterium sp. HMSC068G04]